MANNNENGLAPDGLASDYVIINTGLSNIAPVNLDLLEKSNSITNTGIEHSFDNDIPELNKAVNNTGIESSPDSTIYTMTTVLDNMGLGIGENSGKNRIYYFK